PPLVTDGVRWKTLTHLVRVIEVRTLGGLSVLEGGNAVQLPSRKAAALLAYLSVNQGRVLARSEVAALFWGHAAPEKARHSLGQALYTLRSRLRSLVLEAGRHHVSIPEASVALDVTRCKDLISNGALLDALRLYDGPFLQGFWLSNCPEFEEWQELTRSEIERIIWRAARTLMESAEKEGDWETLEEVTAR